jgi:hypothetical protein
MPTILNKTNRPLKIALPRGKTLHLAPSGRAQVHDDTLERPAFKKLVEAGTVEVLAEGDARPVGPDRGPGRVHDSTHGHGSAPNMPRKGDR